MHLISSFIKRNYLLCFCLLLVSGCAAHRPTDNKQTPFDELVDDSARLQFDKNLQRNSDALHAFIVAELDYSKQNNATALKYYKRSNELLSVPESAVSTRLTELYLKKGSIQDALKEAERGLIADPHSEYLLRVKAGLLELNATDEVTRVQNLSSTIAIYQTLIAQQPQEVDARLLLCSSFVEQKQYQDALVALQGAPTTGVAGALVSYYRALVYEARGELDEAEKQLEHARSIEPDRLHYLFELLYVLVKESKFEKAEELLKEMIKHDSSGALHLSDLLTAMKGDPELALQILNRLRRNDTSLVDTHLKLAVLHLEAQQSDEAVRELLIVLLADPENGEARYYLGSVLVAAGRRDEAIAQLRAIKAPREYALRGVMLGAFVAKQQGNLALSEQIITEGLRREPGNTQLREYLLILFREQKKFADAKTLLEQFKREQPRDERILYSYAVVLDDMGLTEEARVAMEELLIVNPKNTPALNFVAYSLIETGKDPERARVYISKAIELEPANGYYLDTLGWFYFKQNNYPEAVKYLDQAVVSEGDDIVILDHFVDALLKTGDVARARRVAQHALELEIDEHDSELVSMREKLKKLAESPKVLQK